MVTSASGTVEGPMGGATRGRFLSQTILGYSPLASDRTWNPAADPTEERCSASRQAPPEMPAGPSKRPRRFLSGSGSAGGVWDTSFYLLNGVLAGVPGVRTGSLTFQSI